MPDRRYDFVVLGAGVAGTTAVETLREHDKAVDIALVTDEPRLMYYRPRLPGYVAGHVGLEQILERDAEWARARRIDVSQATKAVHLDPSAKVVTLSDGRALRYDKLLVATGARPQRLGVPGEELASVSPLWSLDDAEGIRTAARHARHAVVVGGGFIAAELIEALRLQGVDVTLVARGRRWFYPFTDEAAGEMIRRELHAAGVDARFSTSVTRIEGQDGAVRRVHLSDGTTVPADLVTTSLGARWEMEWFTRAGGRVARGAVTDEWLRTSLPDVWAAGDAADPLNPNAHSRAKTFNVYTAGLQGQMAALGMVGKPRQLQRLPWYGFRILGLFFTFIGMIDTRDPSLDSWVAPASGEDGYTRVFIRDGRVAGGLLVNSALAGPVRRYAESGRLLPSDPGLVIRPRLGS